MSHSGTVGPRVRPPGRVGVERGDGRRRAVAAVGHDHLGERVGVDVGDLDARWVEAPLPGTSHVPRRDKCAQVLDEHVEVGAGEAAAPPTSRPRRGRRRGRGRRPPGRRCRSTVTGWVTAGASPPSAVWAITVSGSPEVRLTMSSRPSPVTSSSTRAWLCSATEGRGTSTAPSTSHRSSVVAVPASTSIAPSPSTIAGRQRRRVAGSGACVVDRGTEAAPGSTDVHLDLALAAYDGVVDAITRDVVEHDHVGVGHDGVVDAGGEGGGGALLAPGEEGTQEERPRQQRSTASRSTRDHGHAE